MEDSHVVIMIEPALPGEDLDVAGQINEVFGTFYSGEVAEHFASEQRQKIPNRHWLVIPLTKPQGR